MSHLPETLSDAPLVGSNGNSSTDRKREEKVLLPSKISTGAFHCAGSSSSRNKGPGETKPQLDSTTASFRAPPPAPFLEPELAPVVCGVLVARPLRMNISRSRASLVALASACHSLIEAVN